MIIKPKDLILEISNLYENKIARGHSTGWRKLDDIFSIKPGEFTVVTGMPSHGKSEWLDNLVVNLALNHNYRIAVFSPENYPLQMHIAKIIEKMTLKQFWGNDRMDQDEMLEAFDKVDKHFAFIKPSENEFTPKHIIDEALPWLDHSKFAHPRAMIIDPWNEMDHYRPNGLSETEYISRVLTELRRAAREFQTHLFLVAHPMKMNKDKDGNYPVPRPYDISGSAHWYNKADNCIAVWRDVKNAPEHTEIHIQKVRFKSTGKPGMAEMEYNHKTSSYQDGWTIKSISRNSA